MSHASGCMLQYPTSQGSYLILPSLCMQLELHMHVQFRTNFLLFTIMSRFMQRAISVTCIHNSCPWRVIIDLCNKLNPFTLGFWQTAEEVGCNHVIAIVNWHKAKECECKLNKWLYGRNPDGHSGRAWFSTKLKMFGSLKWPPATHLPSNWQLTSLACQLSHNNQFWLPWWLRLRWKKYVPALI